MKKLINKLSKKPLKSIILIELLIYLICVLIYYPLIPYLLSYPPNSINTPFQLAVNPMYYWMYYIFLALASTFLIVAISLKKLRPLRKIKNKNISLNEKLNIRKVCLDFNISYILMYGMLIPTILIMLFLLISKTDFILTLKISLLSLVFLGIPNILVGIMSTMILKSVLVNTFDSEVFKKEKYKRTKIWIKFVYQIFFTIMISMVLYFLTFNTTITSELSDNKYNSYYKIFSQSIKDSNLDIQSIKSTMNKEFSQDNWFIRYNGTYIYSNNSFSISDFMDKYINYYGKKNTFSRIYDNFGLSTQGIIYNVSNPSEEIIIGIIYDAFPKSIFMELFLLMGVLLLVNYIIVYMSSSSIGNDLDEISENLALISKNNTIKENLLPITSTDELEKLTTAYNHVQINDTNLVNQIQASQNMLVEQERLASLGQMIGGISHNLKTPIMSISGAAEGLNDLIIELDESIGDPEVTEEDFHDIAKDMKEWITKIHSYTGYMSDVITAVKGQAVTLSEEEEDSFTIYELIKRVEILMKNELKSGHIQLEKELNKCENVKIEGNINSLVQVVNNLISNGIQSYKDKPDGIINFETKKSGNNVVITIEDHGCGIPADVKDKLFKEMITTKGKNGTGLGLFMSYSTIKGKFKGDMKFESKENVGTKFIITLPIT